MIVNLSQILYFNGPTPSPEGLLSNEIFELLKQKDLVYAYIDLGGTFLNPLMYKALTRLKFQNR